MSAELLTFADVESLQDLGTFVSRARVLDEAGAVRLQAQGAVLGAWVCVTPGRGVLGQGVVLGLRVMPLQAPQRVDVTVPLGAISDRLARRERLSDVSATLELPPAAVIVPWAALTPPQSGWTEVGALDQRDLETVAKDGVAEIASATSDTTGGHLVAAAREHVWGRQITSEDGLTWPAALAWAALSLGFLQGDAPVQVRRAAPWTRYSLPHGHVLTR